MSDIETVAGGAFLAAFGVFFAVAAPRVQSYALKHPETRVWPGPYVAVNPWVFRIAGMVLFLAGIAFLCSAL